MDFRFSLKTRQRAKRNSSRNCLADTKTDLFIAIPLTSNLESLKLPLTKNVSKSQENNLERDSVALALQIQALDKRRLIYKIGVLEDNYIKEIDKILKSLLNLN